MVILGLTLLIVALYIVFTVVLPIAVEVVSLLILAMAAPVRSIRHHYREGRKKKAVILSIATTLAIAAVIITITLITRR